LGLGRDSFQIVYVSNVTRFKRQGDAVEALGVLVERGISVQLHLIGVCAPEEEARLAEIATRLGVCRCLHFHGFVSDPNFYLKSGNVALMCSIGEGLGRVTVEAMRCGTPVIAAASAGTLELIQHEVTGLTYEPGNPVSLANAIQRLQEDPELATRLGAAGQQFAMARFSRERFEKEVSLAVTEVLSCEGCGGG
jgi:glycosyltransferase involved in cell wall biosynthesis